MKNFVIVLAILLLFTTSCGGSDIQSQSIGLEGVGNARELGGYTAQGGKSVKHGVLLRTAELSGATSSDILRLQNVYHLAVIADFRMSMEVAQHPDPAIQGAKNVHLKIMDEAALMKDLTSQDLEALRNGDKVGMLILAVKKGVVGEHMYIDFLSGEQGKISYSAMFRELIELPEGRAFLFHCTQGKDRTGCAAMLILAALGVDENTILADFALTNQFNADLIKAQRKILTERGYSGEELDKIMKALDEVDPQYLLNAINWLKQNYGSIVGYISQELGVTHDELDALKAKFLE